jgi:hypothetical protein
MDSQNKASTCTQPPATIKAKLDVVQIPIGDIKPYERNPRKNDHAVDAVVASIREFGWQQPIVVDKGMVIVAGHTRYKAALKLGIEQIPVVIADKLTPMQTKAFRLADNKSGEIATWDFPQLAIELEGLAGFDMADFGFTPLISEFDTIEHGGGDDKAGCSPWDRMNGGCAEGIMFTFGDITCRLPESVYQKFNKNLGNNEVTKWVTEKINSLF